MTDEQQKAVRPRTELDENANPHEPAIDAVQAVVVATISPYIERIRGGLHRVTGLVAVAQVGLEQADETSEKSTAEDILRAAVVLIHAHLEDFIRTIAGALLPAGDENCLNGIPLAGLTGRPEKFLLGKLVRHKGKLVDEVLRESVSDYLERRTFNDTDEIAQTLEALGVDISTVNHAFPEIQRMMKRRHQIVHRADRIEENDPTVLAAISPADVDLWIEVTTELLGALLMQLGIKLLPAYETPGGFRVKTTADQATERTASRHGV